MASQNEQDRRDKSGSPALPSSGQYNNEDMLASHLMATPALQHLLDRPFGSEGESVLRAFGTQEKHSQVSFRYHSPRSKRLLTSPPSRN